MPHDRYVQHEFKVSYCWAEYRAWCGDRKHKCKKKHVPTAPCDDCLSEYRNTYVRKPIGPPKSCKPDQTPMMSDAPAEDKTTSR